MSVKVSGPYRLNFLATATTTIPFVAPEDGYLNSVVGAAQVAISGSSSIAVKLNEAETVVPLTPSAIAPTAVNKAIVPASAAAASPESKRILKGQIILLTVTLGAGALSGSILFDPVDTSRALPQRPGDISKV